MNILDQEDPETPFLNDARALEAEAVRLAEAGDLAAALTVVDRAIDLLPGRPSGYNNRAQVHRLAGRDQGTRKILWLHVIQTHMDNGNIKEFVGF